MRYAALSAILISSVLLSQTRELKIKIEQFMSEEEMKKSGVSSLSPEQREALDLWLSGFTRRVMNVAEKHAQKAASAGNARSPVRSPTSTGGCSTAIESTISGDFNGWEGETVFKLDNGQIWQQSSYAYMYSYSYRPEVTIYQTSGGCRMKVEDEDETIPVIRIK